MPRDMLIRLAHHRVKTLSHIWGAVTNLKLMFCFHGWQSRQLTYFITSIAIDYRLLSPH